MSDFLAGINPRRGVLARELLAGPSPPPAGELQAAVDRTLLHELFRQIATARGIHLPVKPHSTTNADPISTPQGLATLPPDILGRVYEHCLDHPIRLDSGGRPSIEKRSAARKSTGTFYTPAPVVDYIVHQTLGRLLKRASAPADTRAPKTLDPSCGSGSFLIAAYQHLLDWHLARSRSQSLSPAERRQILLDHIHGVDIDPQAVELTKLSLTLLAIDSDTSNPLPDLDQNIRCADSLTLDWPSGFPDTFAGGGFDCIIGNPPYLFGENLDPAAREALKARFPAAASQPDAYQFFLELNGRLASPSATIGMLVPDAILARSGCRPIRQLLLRSGLQRIHHCGPVFGAGVSTTALIQSAGYTGPVANDELADNRLTTRHHCRRTRLESDPEQRFLIHASDPEHALLEKIASSAIPLGDLGTLSRGEELGRKHLATRGPIPILVGRDVSRYHIAPPSHFVDTLHKPATIYQPGKILIVKTGSSPVAALDTEGHATIQSLYHFHPRPDAPDPRYLLAIINSRLIAWWIRKTFTAYKKLFPQLNQETIAGIPVIPPANLDPAVYQAIIGKAEPVQSSTDLAEQTTKAIDQLIEQAFGLDGFDGEMIAEDPAQH